MKSISIKGTADKYSASPSCVPAMQALSRCNTVPKMCGIGKVTALKITMSNPVSFLVNLESTTSDVVQEAKQFLERCYGVRNCTDMSEIR